MKKFLGAIGGGLIVGAAAYFLLNNKKKKGQKASADFKEAESEKVSDNDTSLVHAEVVQDDETGYEDVKCSAIGSMYSRHEGASIIMKDSVETIRENVKISEDTNNEIDEVSTELDKMLSED